MREEIREHIRKAQEAEIAGDAAQAVRHLELAAGLHLESNDWGRAAALYRHCLRLMPDREDLRAALARAETEPTTAVPAAVMPSPELDAALREALEEGPPPPRARREIPQRGPTSAEPDADCWCSFCCRPRDEAGDMVTGPAGAFICRDCIVAAASLQAVELQPFAQSEPVESPPEPVDEGFIEDAVALSQALGWSLSELRSLSPGERARARELVAPAPKSRKKSLGLRRKRRSGR